LLSRQGNVANLAWRSAALIGLSPDQGQLFLLIASTSAVWLHVSRASLASFSKFISLEVAAGKRPPS